MGEGGVLCKKADDYDGKSPCKDYGEEASQGTPVVGVVVDFTEGRLPVPPMCSPPPHQVGRESGFPQLGFFQTLVPSLSLDSMSFLLFFPK